MVFLQKLRRAVCIVLLLIICPLGELYADVDWGAPENTPPAPISIALYPIVSTGTPPESSSAEVGTVIQNAVTNTEIAAIDAHIIEESPEDPAIPPIDQAAKASPYSITSQLFYDASTASTQAQIWLWDNKSENIVVTDQAVYSSVGDAGEFLPFLVDSVIDRINKYEIKLSSTEGGTISIGGTALEKTEDASAILRHSGDTLNLLASADEGYSFAGWKVTYLNEAGATVETPYTDANLSLPLDSTTYFPQAASSEDPFGTIVPITIHADWTTTTEEYSEVDEKDTPPFLFTLGYSPLMLIGENKIADNDYPFNGLLHLMGFNAGFVWFPLKRTWGNVGFGLEFEFAMLNSAYESGVKYSGYFMQPDIRVYYQTPRFLSIMQLRLSLGSGLSLFSPYKVELSGAAPPEEKWKYNIPIIVGLDVEFNIIKNILFAYLGLDYGFFLPDMYSELNFGAGVGIKF
ncbi:MAG: hypothetical protein LBM77_06480 [Spirochaetaceae bacterium]|jgi:hypothetical protein|nr:hypothetical protein [Spirochaetaceae bacterium]